MKTNLFDRLNHASGVLGQHGADMVQALLVLVIGLIALHWLMRQFKTLLDKTFDNRSRAATVFGSVYVLLLTIVLTATMVQLGMDSGSMIRVVVIVSLIAVAVIILFRPYIPTLPFKVGHTVKVGDLLGKIEATSLIHTRIRSFDGKTIFIPNEKILREPLINYQVTPTRRIKINIPIRDIQDILKSKQLLENIMVADPRVEKKPARPVVYTINLVEGCVMLGARCWVKNKSFWVAQCELLEKMLLKLDREGVALAFRSKALRVFHETPLSIDGLTATAPESESQGEAAPVPASMNPLVTAVPTDNLEL